MEKIYMENKKQRKKSVVDFSVVLSFAVAAFAVFSLAAFAVSNNQKSGVSYAAPNQKVDSFVLALPTFTDAYGEVYDDTIDAYTEDGDQYTFPFYYMNSIDENNQVFCLERARENISEGYQYVFEGYINDDPGLVYLLNLPNDSEFLSSTSSYPSDVRSWIIQSAIWKYLVNKYPGREEYELHNEGYFIDASILNSSSFDELSRASSNTHLVSGDATANLMTLVNKYVSNANNPSASGSGSGLQVTSEGSSLSKTEDGKSYRSGLITVSGLGSSYEVSTSGSAKAIIIDENGEEYGESGTVPAGKRFFIQVAASDVKAGQSQNINVSVTGTSNELVGLKYRSERDVDDDVDGPRQRLAYAMSAPVQTNKGISFEFVPGTPDTGMKTSQTIYFIGLIVLLCGVGIVYANAKPVEIKQ